MSIKEVGKKSNPPDSLPNEEEFDIVSTHSVAQNKGGIKKHLVYAGILLLIGLLSFGVGKLITNKSDVSAVTVSSGPISSAEVASPAEIVNTLLARNKAEETVSQAKKIEITPKAPRKATASPQRTKIIVPVAQAEQTLKSGPIVASKHGSKYYLTTCSGVKRISEANKIYFATEEDAKNAGLTPSSTCKGLKP